MISLFHSTTTVRSRVSAERAFVEKQPLLALGIRVHVAADDGIPLRFRPTSTEVESTRPDSRPLPAAISGLIAGPVAGHCGSTRSIALSCKLTRSSASGAVATHRVELIFNLVQSDRTVSGAVRPHGRRPPPVDRRVLRRSRNFRTVGELAFAANQESRGTHRRGERTGERRITRAIEPV